jgi:hypothetical protein
MIGFTLYVMENIEFVYSTIKEPTLSLVKALGSIMDSYIIDRCIVVYLSTCGE